MGFLLISVVSLLVVLGWAYVTRKKSQSRADQWEYIIGALIITVILTIIVAGVLWVGIGLNTTSAVNRMSTFYNVNTDYFIDARERLYQGVPKSLPNEGPAYVFFDSANYHQILPYAKNVVDTRDHLVTYNNHLTSHRYLQDSFFIGMFWKNLPDHMKYITVADSVTIEKRIQAMTERGTDED